MKVSGYVVQTNSVSLDRLVEYRQEGILGNVYVQVEHNLEPAITRNREVFPVWKEALPGKVFAWLWGTEDAGADAERVAMFDEMLDPDGWCLNDEIDTFFHDRSVVYEACSGKPTVIGPIGYPQISPLDYRHADQYGCLVDFQAYDLNGVNDKDPADLVGALFQVPKVILADPGNDVTWWYRVFFDNLLASGGKIVKRWAWVRARQFEADNWIALQEGRNTWYTRAENRDGYGYFLTDRVVVNRGNGRKVGRVFGLARYPNIATSLSVERPVTPEQLKALAARGRVENASLRPVTLYTLDNATDAHFRAVASL